MNVRLPEKALGDLRAQIIAVTTGERRYLELVTRYGWAAVRGSIRRHHGPVGGARPRATRANIPDGVYEAE